MTSLTRTPVLPAVSLRDLVLPVLAVGAIAAQAQLHLALGLPGWRGLIWLSALVATAVGRRGAATAVGGVSAVIVLVAGGDPAEALRYAAAGALLDAALLVPAVRRWPALLVVLAAPIHLVALLVPVLHGTRLLTLADRVPTHLLFGLAAGLIGWVVAATWRSLSYRR